MLSKSFLVHKVLASPWDDSFIVPRELEVLVPVTLAMVDFLTCFFLLGFY